MTDTISLPARLDRATLRTLLTDLTSARRDKVIRLDASEVTHMGALAVQMILAAACGVRADGGTLEIVAISERAQEQLAMMGLSPQQLSEGLT